MALKTPTMSSKAFGIAHDKELQRVAPKDATRMLSVHITEILSLACPDSVIDQSKVLNMDYLADFVRHLHGSQIATTFAKYTNITPKRQVNEVWRQVNERVWSTARLPLIAPLDTDHARAGWIALRAMHAVFGAWTFPRHREAHRSTPEGHRVGLSVAALAGMFCCASHPNIISTLKIGRGFPYAVQGHSFNLAPAPAEMGEFLEELKKVVNMDRRAARETHGVQYVLFSVDKIYWGFTRELREGETGVVGRGLEHFRLLTRCQAMKRSKQR